ncbi:MAG: hypothetical protein LRZ85_06840 [Alphaproteobacteria bacterium]|nr:hypothetical protein [Alphaproteobacteria bacterium]
MIERSFLSLNSHGFHNVVYSDWGPEDGDIIICVHGLTGNGHDFDEIAPKLVEGWLPRHRARSAGAGPQ